jgi:hypothetical protein
VKILVTILISLFSSNCFSSGTRFSIPKQKRAYYSFKEACNRVGYSETLIVEAIGVRALNCMGAQVQISKICLTEKKFKLEPFIRGYADLKNKKIVCQFGKQALLTLSCENEKTRKYCNNPKKSCERFNKKFASELDLSHQSRLFKNDQELLHCYYTYSKNEMKEEKSLLDIPVELSF